MPLSFFKGKKVFLTGHTGFKGTWMCHLLAQLGATVTGYALPLQEGAFFSYGGADKLVHSVYGDVRDLKVLSQAFKAAQPEVVIHMAAQPLVRESYRHPAYTYETNVMGTVNVLECVRENGSVRSFLNVTTDKVYHNNEWAWGYRETDPLDGHDPYSNSKSCAELVTHSYKSAFLSAQGVAVSTARAGNVIGSGDEANDRIIPDCVRAALAQLPIEVRNPQATRPYQHVLEPLLAYLLIVQKQWENPALAGWYNVGPEDADCACTGRLVDLFCRHWGEGLGWQKTAEEGPHEANFLKLDCSKIKSTLGWQPVWALDEAVRYTVEGYKAHRDKQDIAQMMAGQIADYMQKAGFIKNV
ncbi:MAG: CDP-glucose 4,6-dehydratase [Oscillospiraceae bacterium]